MAYSARISRFITTPPWAGFPKKKRNAHNTRPAIMPNNMALENISFLCNLTSANPGNKDSVRTTNQISAPSSSTGLKSDEFLYFMPLIMKSKASPEAYSTILFTNL